MLELCGEGWGRAPDYACFVVWEWKKGDWSGWEEALVCCAQGGRLERFIQSDGSHDTMLAVIPTVGGNICELPDWAVRSVCSYKQTSSKLAVVWKCQDWPLREIWRIVGLWLFAELY